MAFADILFWVLAVAAIASALGVVLLRDVFRAALLLVVVFLAVAGFFVMMNAEFLGVVQLIIYVGAISILIVFAILMTQDVVQGNLPNRLQIPAVLLPALLLAALAFVAFQTDWNLISDNPEAQQHAELVQANTIGGVTDEDAEQLASPEAAARSSLGDLLINDFVLPFEMASVLLLAAVIGALALTRERSA